MKKMDRAQLYSEGVKLMSCAIPATLALPTLRSRRQDDCQSDSDDDATIHAGLGCV